MNNILNLQYNNLNDIVNQHNCSKIFVEIGCGNGTFLSDYALSHPDDLIFGFDVSSLSVVKTSKLLSKNKVKNAFVSKFDARFLGLVFDPHTIDAVYMNYPIPWIRKPKKRNHRVVTNRFVEGVSRVLKFNGKFRMISDSRWYVNYVAGKFLSSNHFELFDYKESSTPFINTKYEKKWIEDGRKLYWLSIVNKNYEDFKKRKVQMPHTFAQSLDIDKILKIKNEYFVKNDNGYIYKRAYKGEEEILIKTISIDDGFNQNYFIKIVLRDDKYMIKLDDFAKPIITESVKSSVFNFTKSILDKKEE